MNLFRKILLASDFSEPSKRAQAHAVELAQSNKAQLHVLHVEEIHVMGMDGESFTDQESLDSSIREATLKALSELEFPAQLDAVTASERAVSVPAAILHYADENGIDLIVTGSYGRTGFARWFLGSVAQEVVRRSPVPVLVVGGEERTFLGAAFNILVPLDFSKPSLAALRAAKVLAGSSGTVNVMHSIDLTPLPHYYSARLEEAHRKEAQGALSIAIADAGLPADTAQVIHDGPAELRIAETARDCGANLIAMGTAGHGIVDRLLVGSTTERVLRSAPCPVLAFRGEPPRD